MTKRLKLGMVGGGQGAFIGAVHRLCARLDDKYEFVAGCLSSTPEKAAASAEEIEDASNFIKAHSLKDFCRAMFNSNEFLFTF